VNELKKEWFAGCKNAGVCGATSTPMWLMSAVVEGIKTLALL